MKHVIYIGIDDTDTLTSVGTGKVAKGLAKCLGDLDLGVSRGVSRHQLLVDSRIPYTSHNSSKGIALETEKETAEFIKPCIEYMQSCFQEGSDPGLCICADNQVNAEIIEYGKSAVSRIIIKQDALNLAAKYKIFLKELGGSGDGAIGALAAVGLRAWGNEGRLVDLAGIKEIKGLISVRELLAGTAIESVRDASGKDVEPGVIIDSLGWIRPSLVGGRPVLRVQPLEADNPKSIWVPIERKNSKAGEKGE